MSNRYDKYLKQSKKYHKHLINYFLDGKGHGDKQMDVLVFFQTITQGETDKMLDLRRFLTDYYFEFSYKRFNSEYGTPATFIANCLLNKLKEIHDMECNDEVDESL